MACPSKHLPVLHHTSCEDARWWRPTWWDGARRGHGCHATASGCCRPFNLQPQVSFQTMADMRIETMDKAGTTIPPFSASEQRVRWPAPGGKSWRPDLLGHWHQEGRTQTSLPTATQCIIWKWHGALPQRKYEAFLPCVQKTNLIVSINTEELNQDKFSVDVIKHGLIKAKQAVDIFKITSGIFQQKHVTYFVPLVKKIM